MNKLLLSPAEAAETLGIGRTKLYELLGAGVIRSVHIGRGRKIPPEALAEYVHALQAATGGELCTTGSTGPTWRPTLGR